VHAQTPNNEKVVNFTKLIPHTNYPNMNKIIAMNANVHQVFKWTTQKNWIRALRAQTMREKSNARAQVKYLDEIIAKYGQSTLSNCVVYSGRRLGSFHITGKTLMLLKFPLSTSTDIQAAAQYANSYGMIMRILLRQGQVALDINDFYMKRGLDHKYHEEHELLLPSTTQYYICFTRYVMLNYQVYYLIDCVIDIPPTLKDTLELSKLPTAMKLYDINSALHHESLGLINRTKPDVIGLPYRRRLLQLSKK
jgi:hypothetical protein